MKKFFNKKRNKKEDIKSTTSKIFRYGIKNVPIRIYIYILTIVIIIILI